METKICFAVRLFISQIIKTAALRSHISLKMQSPQTRVTAEEQFLRKLFFLLKIGKQSVKITETQR